MKAAACSSCSAELSFSEECTESRIVLQCTSWFERESKVVLNVMLNELDSTPIAFYMVTFVSCQRDSWGGDAAVNLENKTN